MNKKTCYVVTSWDDTNKLDLKLADLLDEYGVKGTFFAVTGWIGGRIDSDDLRCLSEDHEVGAHTVTHLLLTETPVEVAEKEILDSGRMLSEILGVPMSKMSFAYPYGEYSVGLKRLVESAGYCCARTTKPFSTGYPRDVYEMPVSVWAYPHALGDIGSVFRVARVVPRVLRDPLIVKRWDCLAKRLFDVVLSKGGLFHLLGHSRQVDERDDWCRLEEVLAYVGHRNEVEYATLSEYCLPTREEENVSS